MKNKYKVLLLSFATIILWALAFSITKIAQQHFSPTPLGLWRCTLAALMLLIFSRIRHVRLPQKKDIPWFFLSGAFGFTIYLITFNTGMMTVTTATGSIIIALAPIMTAIIASFLYNEKINLIGWLCISSAFAGVIILLLWDGILSINIGMLWTFIAAVVFCGYNIVTRLLSSKGYTALEVVTYSMLCGSILFCFSIKSSLSELMTAQPIHVLAVLFLALFPSAIGFVMWSKAISMAERTSEVTNFLFLSPFLTAVFGMLIVHEKLSAGTAIGGVIIVISIVLFNLKGKAVVKAKDTAPEEYTES